MPIEVNVKKNNNNNNSHSNNIMQKCMLKSPYNVKVGATYPPEFNLKFNSNNFSITYNTIDIMLYQPLYHLIGVVYEYKILVRVKYKYK